MRLKSSRVFVSFLLTSASLLYSPAAPAQTRRPGPKPAVNSCDGGWSGTITYARTENKNGREDRPTGYIGNTSSYSATAEVVVNEDGSARAKVNVRVSDVTEDVKEGTDCCSITLAGCSRKGGFRNVDVVRTESAAEAEAGVKGVGTWGETFDAHISLPAAVGKSVRTFQTIRKRECDNVDQNSSHEQQAAASYAVGPIRLSVPVDPQNPNVLRGTQTDGDVTITYDLKRCAGSGR